MSPLEKEIADFLDSLAGPYRNPNRVTFDIGLGEDRYVVSASHPGWSPRPPGKRLTLFLEELSVFSLIGLFGLTCLADLVDLAPADLLQAFHRCETASVYCVLEDKKTFLFKKEGAGLWPEDPLTELRLGDRIFSVLQPEVLMDFSRAYFKYFPVFHN